MIFFAEMNDLLMYLDVNWNNYFICPDLENAVALFVGGEKSTFPFYFGSEMSENEWKNKWKRMIFER